MSNRYFTHTRRGLPGQVVRSSDYNATLDSVNTGFDTMQTDIDAAVLAQSNNATTATNKAAEALASANSASDSAASITAAAATANNYATKADGYASGTDNSAKSWAIGGTGSGQPTSGSAKDWATKTTAEVETGQGYGAKKYAQDASASATAAASSAAQASAVTGLPFPNSPGKALLVNSAGNAYVLGAAGATDTPDVADGAGNLQGESDYYLPAGAQDGQQALVEKLGLFVFRSTATDPVDGETCIAPVSGSGRWLLICPTWDFVYAWLSGTDLTLLTNDIATLNARFLSASSSLDFPTIAATTGEATLTITVTGAAIGDRVILAPPDALPAGLIPAGYVSAANTVSIKLFNNTAGSIDPAAMTWGVTVMKG